MRLDSSSPSLRFAISALALAATVAWVAIADVRAAPIEGDPPASADHVAVSEVMTGGASASDEFVELYNPTASAQSLDGLELVYVTATGATITRKAVWGPDAEIEPRGHMLVANEAGLFAGIADATYAGGLAAAGGSMALRPIGAATGLDAVGWGTATSTWLETAPAPAAPAGSSLERLPGGPLGSGQDTNHNLVDFVVRSAPDPQNSASLPVPVESPTPSASDTPDASTAPTTSPSASPTEEPTETPSPTPEPTETPSSTPSPIPTPLQTPTPEPTATPTPTPTALTVAEARARPDGALVVVAGTSLTGSDFYDGGGYVADATGGIAVLVEGGTFPRGVGLVVAGTVDDRYAQRTVRVDIADVGIDGASPEPESSPAETGAIGEAHEGTLVEISGLVQGSPTELASGLAFEVDDGSGPVRVLIGPATGISTADWLPGTALTLIGVVGQRDSSGTGTDGYRVQPRDDADVTLVSPPPTPQPTPTPSSSSSPLPTSYPSPTATPSAIPLVPIADARQADVGARVRIRGVVTMPTGLVEEGSAVVQDASGAILIRAGSEVGRLRRGQLVELTGTRSTKSGMVSLRVSAAAIIIGTQAEPVAVRRTTGGIREADEAVLVVIRGLVRDGPRRTTGGGLTFTLNDGSGPFRVFVSARTGITARNIPQGAWVEVHGVVGQQTTGAQPNEGYRLWPRDRADVTVVAGTTAAGKTTRAGGTMARSTIPKPSPSAGPPVRLSRPILTGMAALAPTGTTDPVGSASTAPPVPPIRVPLAAGLGGLAGLLVLAWRHGTLRRAMAELEHRASTIWRPASDGDEEDEPYTPAP
jgi:Lamin Tail Domain